jgi:repressor LexA
MDVNKRKECYLSMAFKDSLRRARKKKGLTQSDMAKLTGLKVSTISMYENGNREPNFETLELLADFFNIDMDTLLDKEKKGIRIPVLGKVAAGIPIEAITDIEDWEEIPQSMSKTGEYFALKIAGKSMEPRMMDGDVVIVRRQPDVDSGDIAVVLVNGNDATVKQISKSDAGLTLIGWNPSVYTPKTYNKKECKELPVSILGKVIEIRGKL